MSDPETTIPDPSDTHVGRESTRDEVDRSAYWDEIYDESEDNSPGWNLGIPSPELEWQLENARPEITPGRIAVLGCGYGHDALLLAQKGFQVTAVDFSDWAIKGARENFEKAGMLDRIDVHQGDVFELPAAYSGSFDYVLEHTCYCAIHPSRRAEYRDVVHDLLQPNGQIIGLFYFHRKQGGPPYNTTPEEVREIWQQRFDIQTLTIAQHSYEPRAGKEVWARFYRG